MASLHDTPTATFKSPRLLAKLTTGAFVIFAVGCVWEMLLSLEALSAIAHPETIDASWGEAFDARFEQAAYGSLAFYVLTALCFGLWTVRVATNARRFDREQLSVSPGWALGYYFVPILSLWRPYQALAEIWRASSSGDRKHVPAWVTAWWFAWIISTFADRVLATATTSETLEQWASVHRKIIATDVLQLLATVLAMAVVWRLTRIQDERALAESPARATVERG